MERGDRRVLRPGQALDEHRPDDRPQRGFDVPGDEPELLPVLPEDADPDVVQPAFGHPLEETREGGRVEPQRLGVVEGALDRGEQAGRLGGRGGGRAAGRRGEIGAASGARHQQPFRRQPHVGPVDRLPVQPGELRHAPHGGDALARLQPGDVEVGHQVLAHPGRSDRVGGARLADRHEASLRPSRPSAAAGNILRRSGRLTSSAAPRAEQSGPGGPAAGILSERPNIHQEET